MEQYKEHKKQVNKYIKENLNKGHSLEAVKRAFIKHGYDPDLSENLIKGFRTKSIFEKSVPWFLIFILLSIPAMFFLKPSITTLTIKTKDYSYTDSVGLTFDESTVYIWNLQNKGFLKSVKLNGEVKNNGTVKIYLEDINNRYLIFDNQKLEEEIFESITAFAIKEVEIEIGSQGNLTEEEIIILNFLIVDINETRNNVEIEIEIGENGLKKEIKGDLTEAQELLVDTFIEILKNRNEDVRIKIESEFEEIEVPEEVINDTINITNVTIINETVENFSINNVLEYKKGSVYDEDDDGIENIDNAIDFTVENSEFNWDVNEENLCTIWDTYSIENEENTRVCYGSNTCCNFIGLLPTRPAWNEIFYSSYGTYGATLKNVISAQILYVDFNLSLDDPFAEIYYSDWKNLSVGFYQGFARFENICIETCILPNLDSASYRIVIEINNSGLILESINYEILGYETINNPPVILKNFTNISFFKDQSHTINLSEYFYDPDNNTLFFDFYKKSKVDVTIINETAILSSNNPIKTTYMFFTANDTEYSIVSNIFKIEVENQQGRTFDLPGLKSLRQLIGLG